MTSMNRMLIVDADAVHSSVTQEGISREAKPRESIEVRALVFSGVF